MLTWRWRPPTTSTWPTPLTLSSWRRSVLSAYSVMSRIGLSADTASVMHRRGVGIELLDRRLLDVLRQQRQHAVDAVAHFLRRDVAVLLEQERDDDRRDAFRRGRAQLVDAADGVDGFLDLVGDLGFDFLGRRAGQPRRHHDGGEVDLRETDRGRAA